MSATPLGIGPTRITASGTDTITAADVGGSVGYGAACTVTITSELLIGSRVRVYGTADGVVLAFAASGGESAPASVTISTNEGRELVKTTSLLWRCLRLGATGGAVTSGGTDSSAALADFSAFSINNLATVTAGASGGSIA